MQKFTEIRGVEGCRFNHRFQAIREPSISSLSLAIIVGFKSILSRFREESTLNSTKSQIPKTDIREAPLHPMNLLESVYESRVLGNCLASTDSGIALSLR